MSYLQRPRSVPYVPSRVTKVHRSSQWLQRSTEDLKANNLGAKQWTGLASATGVVQALSQGSSIESDDLQAMVHNFIENDSVDDMDVVDSDGASPGLKLSEKLQMLIAPHNSAERELLADVRRLLLTANEETDLICNTDGSECQGSCTKRFVVKHLNTAGYNASVCKTTWPKSGQVPGGEYEYIDVMFKGECVEERLIVDINFHTQFEIARPTQQYETALKSLPTVFAGTTANLEEILKLMSEAAKLSLKQNDMHLPPWRKLEYMRAKWLSKFERRSNFVVTVPYKEPSRSIWRDNYFLIPSEARQCGDELRCTKVSLISEAKGSGLLNLPRGRSSEGNTFLKIVL